MANDNKSLPVSLNNQLDFDTLIPKKQSLDMLARKVIKEQNPQELSKIFDEFRIVSVKKELVRMIKLSEFSDMADEEIGKRLKEHPERLRNSEIVEFSRLLKDSIDKSDQKIASVLTDSASVIPVNVTKNEINVNNYNLNTASREKVRSAITDIFSNILNPNNKVDTSASKVVDANINENTIIVDDSTAKEEELNKLKESDNSSSSKFNLKED